MVGNSDQDETKRGRRALPPQGARQIHPLSGVNPNPPAWRVDSLVMFCILLQFDDQPKLDLFD
jgi:hypothetical protein